MSHPRASTSFKQYQELPKYDGKASLMYYPLRLDHKAKSSLGVSHVARLKR